MSTSLEFGLECSLLNSGLNESSALRDFSFPLPLSVDILFSVKLRVEETSLATLLSGK